MTTTGDWLRQRSGQRDCASAGQRRRETGVRGHKRGRRPGNRGDHQRRPYGRRRRGGILHDQRGRTEPGERAGENGRREMGPSRRADQQRRNRRQRTANGRHGRSNKAHGGRELDGPFLGESLYKTDIYSRKQYEIRKGRV